MGADELDKAVDTASFSGNYKHCND